MRLITEKDFQRDTEAEIDFCRLHRAPTLIALTDKTCAILLPCANVGTIAAYEMAQRKGSPLLNDVSQQEISLALLTERKYAPKPSWL